MYPEKLIFDVAGFPSIRGRDLVERLVEQANAFAPTYRLGVLAEGLTYVDDRPVLTLSNGETWRVRRRADHRRARQLHRPSAPGGDRLPGDGIVYFVPQLADLAGHHVVIAGGGDSAFDWASSLSGVAKSVTLVHRRDRFRAHASTVTAVRAMPVEIIVNAEITRIERSTVVSAAWKSRKRVKAPRLLPADDDRGRARFHRRSRSARRLGA